MNKERIINSRDFLEDAALIDDFFMSIFFKDNPECVEQILNAVLPVAVKVKSMDTQYKIDNVYGRDVIFDIYAEDEKNKKYDIEIQRRSDGASPQRARFHSVMLDVRSLGHKKEFTDMTDTYVIFITEHDKFKGKKPLYRIERTILDTEQQFNDGSHIMYVNLAYKGSGDSKLEEIIHDFKCKETKDIQNEILRKRFEELKVHPTEKELDDMSSLLELRFQKIADEILKVREEEIREEWHKKGEEEGREKNSREIAENLLLMGTLSVEQIAECCHLTIEQVNKLKDPA